jgi:uncharacterized YigZ family protein
VVVFHVKHTETIMAETLQTLTHSVTTEFTIKGSRFIGVGEPWDDPGSVKRRVEEIRQLYRGCTHVAHAMIVGTARAQTEGAGDDGEPHGTAGHPMLAILRGHSVSNVLIAGVRFFGGTKLGRGGLVRAYADTARAVLEKATLTPLERRVHITLDVPYTYFDAAKQLLDAEGADILEEQFGVTVQVQASVSPERYDALLRELRDVSNGSVTVEERSDPG